MMLTSSLSLNTPDQFLYLLGQFLEEEELCPGSVHANPLLKQKVSSKLGLKLPVKEYGTHLISLLLLPTRTPASSADEVCEGAFLFSKVFSFFYL